MEKQKQPDSISNHNKAPLCAAFVEKMREAFGKDQVTVLYVKEGAFEIGKRP